MMANNLIKDKKGFSFIEVMISVFVLSVGIVAIISLMTGNIKNSAGSRDNIIASELAQEGVEIVRNIRDNNFLNNPSDPFNGLSDGNSYRVDYNNGISSAASYQLNYSNSGFYTYSSGTATKFYRRIDITNYESSAFGRKITSTVIWGGNSIPSSPVDSTKCNMSNKCFYIEDILTDWAN